LEEKKTNKQIIVSQNTALFADLSSLINKKKQMQRMVISNKKSQISITIQKKCNKHTKYHMKEHEVEK
jgi:hypothetical protein